MHLHLGSRMAFGGTHQFDCGQVWTATRAGRGNEVCWQLVVLLGCKRFFMPGKPSKPTVSGGVGTNEATEGFVNVWEARGLHLVQFVNFSCWA